MLCAEIVGAVVSTIITFEVVEALLPLASVAVHTTVVVPSANESGEPESDGEGSARSVTDGETRVGVVVAPVASNI